MKANAVGTVPDPGEGLVGRGRLPGGTSGRWLVATFAAVMAVAIGWLVLGMPGMDHDTGGEHASMTVDTLGPSEFADRLADPEAFVVNVHQPNEGEIEGTDALIPYDQIAGDPRLPVAKSTPVVLYCLTGRMSETAARTLMAEGYTDVAHLGGGMQAWREAGREVLPREP